MNFKKYLLEITDWQIQYSKDIADKKDLLDVNPDLFKNIFEDNSRIILSLNKDEACENILGKLKNYKFDLEKNFIEYKTQKIKIGKFILNKNSIFSKEDKEWWIKQSNPLLNLKLYEEKSCSIILSKNPIDILRMSDFEDNIHSCHAPNREYFDNAILEAKNGGFIAYVVANKELNKIKNLEDNEIFSDPCRKIDGIKPLSRLRIRNFYNDYTQEELAIPEIRIYGKQISGFYKAVKEFLKEKQNKISSYEMHDYKLKGGSYRDNTASELFNRYFDEDNFYSGDVEHIDGEGKSLYDQIEEELADIMQKYYEKYDDDENIRVYASIEGDENDPYIYSNFSFQVTINKKLLKKEFNCNNHREEINELILENYFNNISGEIEFSEDFTNGFLVTINNDDLNIDHVENFMEQIAELERNRNEIITIFYEFLYEKGYLIENNLLNKNTKQKIISNFTNFELKKANKFYYLKLKKPLIIKVYRDNYNQKIYGSKQEINLNETIKEIINIEFKKNLIKYLNLKDKNESIQKRLFNKYEKKYDFNYNHNLFPKLNLIIKHFDEKEIIFLTYLELDFLNFYNLSDEEIEKIMNVMNFIDKEVNIYSLNKILTESIEKIIIAHRI